MMPPFTLPLHVLVFTPLLAATVGILFPLRWFKRWLFLAHAITVVLTLQLFVHVRSFGPIMQFLAGWPEGIAIKLSANSLSLPMVLLSVLFCAGVYAFSTRAEYTDKTFLFLTMLLETSMIAIFLSGDLFNIYVLIELGMLIIAVLIMYKRDKQSVYDAMLYLMINFIAMAFMLLGLGFIYRMAGTLDLDLLKERLSSVKEPRTLILPFALIITAIATKSALFPLFSWLPRAHGAPSAPGIVSAILSGVQVKIGVYLLVLTTRIFSPPLEVAPFLMAVGFITAVAGFLLAITQTDIKLILAYSTVSQVGLIVFGLNLGHEQAWWGGMLHVINHALFKGLLFLTAGVIIDHYGTRSYDKIRGVFHTMPAIAVATLAGILGITGAPLFNGSISKYFIQQGFQGSFGELTMFILNLGTTLTFVKYATILFGKPTAEVSVRRDPWVAGVSLLFGTACLTGGLAGTQAVFLLFGPVYSTTQVLYPEKILAFGVTLALALGLFLFVVRRAGGFLSVVRSYKFSFNTITMMLTTFFMVVVGYLYFVTP